MRVSLRHIVFFCALVFCFPTARAAADDVDYAAMRARLFELIAQARANPLAMAAALGLDPEKVSAGLPGMRAVFERGLPPLVPDERLTAAAVFHCRDMLTNDFYGREGSDGLGPRERLRQFGYDAAASERVQGLVGFVNFIDPDKAVARLFGDLYRNELDPAFAGGRVILSETAIDLGVGIGAGVLTLDGVPYNVYVAVIDVGMSAADMAASLTEMVNQLREKPLETLYAAGVDPSTHLERDPALALLLSGGLPPVMPDETLAAVSGAHTADMLAHNFIDHAGSDGRGLFERVRDAGYFPAKTNEVIAAAGFGAGMREAAGAARDVFASLLRAELDACVLYGAPALLDPAMSEAGTGVGTGLFVFDADPLAILMTTVAMASPDAPRPPRLAVTVYDDRDGDGLYGFGEGCPRATVRPFRYTPFGYVATDALLTNGAGGVLVPVTSGYWKVTVEAPGQDPVDHYLKVEGGARLAHRVDDYRHSPVWKWGAAEAITPNNGQTVE